ncbi:hypothetical protein G6F56_000737 [Rhizopus delemar]|nr:hypothetical protein G6F56_000737 [Rhizopus delemar]
MKIGDHVTIGEGSIVEAATIGSHVSIGKNCIIGRFAIIKDCCCILDNTIIAPNTVVPSFSVYGGSPGIILSQEIDLLVYIKVLTNLGKYQDELPECTQELYENKTKDYYDKFTPKD